MSFLKNASITTKVWIMVILALVTMMGGSIWNAFGSRDDFLAERKLKTRHLVEAAHAVLAQFQEAEKSGSITREQAQAGAIKAIKGMRYEKTEYFWIHDLTAPVPKMIMHPTVPALDGKVLDSEKFNSATSIQAGLAGKVVPVSKQNLFVAFNVAINEAGHGFVTYDWPKPLPGGGASKELFPKLSYIKKFDEWNWVIGSGIYIDDLDKRVQNEVVEELIRALITAIVLMIISYLVSRSITQPLILTARTMVDIADKDGDLTLRVPEEGGKEIQALANGFNRFVTKIEGIIVQVSEASIQATQSANQLSTVIQKTAANVATQRQEIQSVSSSTDTLAAAITEVANTAIQTAEAARQADKQTHEGKAVVDRTLESINQLARNVIQATDVVEHLASDSSNISGILDVIKGIADQTNLLALNAAIEAARAGEYGRGFAVVADEVRKLALQTQEATNRIHKMIEGLQQNAQSAVKVMQSSKELAESSIEQAGQTSASLDSIANAVANISQSNEKNAANAEEQAAETEEIKASIDSVNDAAGQTAQLAKETENVTSDVTSLVAKLQNMVNQFKVANQNKKLDLSKAKAAHLAWKARLRSFLDGHAVLTQEQAVSHHHCDFGKWYYSTGLASYGHIPALREVEEPHAELHRTIKEIIQAKSAGNKAEAERLFAKVDSISSRIVSLLTTAENSV